LDLLHTPIQASALKIVQLFLRQKISGEFAHSLIPKCKNSRGGDKLNSSALHMDINDKERNCRLDQAAFWIYFPEMSRAKNNDQIRQKPHSNRENGPLLAHGLNDAY
jgi:hypothetical protein